jgi:NAD(P)-dependent dehydrogenase (short-subunit alcohol dehydrogenase family)
MANKIIITGANEGIGYSIVEQLLFMQNCVVVFDVQTNNLKELEMKYPEQLLIIEGDVKDEKAINDAVNKCIIKFGGIDIAVHNACKCTFDDMENTSEEVYKEVFDVNYFGALRLTKAVIP